MLWKPFLFSVLGFFVGACSIETERCTDVNQTRIYQSYSAAYSTQDDETSINAQFRFGGGTGTTLELVDNCDVTHDAYAFSKNALSSVLGTFYIGSGSGYKADHEFVFTDGDGGTYTNSITNQQIVAVTSHTGGESVSKGSDLSVTWSGGELAEDESMILTVRISQTESGSSTLQTVVASETDEGATSITMLASKLAELTLSGTGNIYLQRSYSTSLQQATEVGGGLSYSYESPWVEITLTD